MEGEAGQGPGGEAPFRRPLATYGLVAALAVVFALQVSLGQWNGLLAPTLQSLIAFGASSPAWVVDRGERYRLAAATFLHGGPLHLLLDGLALWLGGALLESLLGRSWLLAAFGLGVLGGGAAGLLVNGPGVISVGASGAIVSVLAASFLATFRIPAGPARSSARRRLLYGLAAALVPLANLRQEGHVDFAAHLGGAAAGLALGAVALATWRGGERLPRSGRLAAVLAAVCAVVVVASLGQALANGPGQERGFRLSARLAPDAAVQRLRTATSDRRLPLLEELRGKYPTDPRTQYFSALVAAERDEPEEAEGFLRRGLAEREMLETFFSDGKLEASMRALLARLLLVRQAEAEAREVFHPACGVARDAKEPGPSPEWVATVCGK